MNGRTSNRRWLRWPIGAMMIAVAVFALAFAVVRRNTPEAVAITLASKTLTMYDPGYLPEDFRADGVAKSGAYWKVHYTRVKGVGKPSTEAYVHDWMIQTQRRRFWEPHPKRPYFLTVDASGKVGVKPAETMEE